MRVAHALCAQSVLLHAAAPHGNVAYKVFDRASAPPKTECESSRRLAILRREVVITMTLQNLEPGFATFLPKKSPLTDDRENVYRSIETRDWRFTDKRFFLGVRLAGNAEYTGTMRFAVPPGSNERELHVRDLFREDDRSSPFGVALPRISVVL